MSNLYENCYCLKKKSNSLICKNETKERDELTIIIYYNCDTGLYVPYYFWSVYKSFHLQHWSRKKNIGSSACSNYMHIYMLTKLHYNIFYKHIIRLFGLTKQQLEAGFQTTGGMILFCYSTCIIFVTYFFVTYFLK